MHLPGTDVSDGAGEIAMAKVVREIIRAIFFSLFVCDAIAEDERNASCVGGVV